MFINTQVNFWYKSQRHTTRRSGYTAGESDFCRFSKIHTPKQPKLIFAVQKCFFLISTKRRFWTEKILVSIFYRSYTHENCLLIPRQTSGTNLSIIRHVEVATLQEKVIFVDFWKFVLQISQKISVIFEDFWMSCFF